MKSFEKHLQAVIEDCPMSDHATNMEMAKFRCNTDRREFIESTYPIVLAHVATRYEGGPEKLADLAFKYTVAAMHRLESGIEGAMLQ